MRRLEHIILEDSLYVQDSNLSGYFRLLASADYSMMWRMRDLLQSHFRPHRPSRTAKYSFLVCKELLKSNYRTEKEVCVYLDDLYAHYFGP